MTVEVEPDGAATAEGAAATVGTGTAAAMGAGAAAAVDPEGTIGYKLVIDLYRSLYGCIS